jgi:hypothetical protein
VPSLPIVPLPNGTITEGPLAGVEYHSLSRAQAMQINTFAERPDEAEDFILACGTGVSVEEAHSWREETGVHVAGELVDAIILISGLTSAKGV